MPIRTIAVVALAASLIGPAGAEDPPSRGEEVKAAAIAKWEADIGIATERKTEAARNRDDAAVKRLSQDLRWLRLQLSKAKAQSPQQYAEEAAAAEERAEKAADKKKQADETVAFWADPRGRATVAAARLYRDLLAFRSRPDFAEFGFGRGGPYYLWLKAAETVADRDGKAGARRMLEQHDCCLGELVQLGMEYAESRGKETPYTIDVIGRLGPAFEAIEKEAEERAREKAGAGTP
jgi:hypothetical protein